ncbi:hypothetical protein VTH8203_02921 [Vibrio thalassae]|uniref:ABC transporter permease n=1 Tax=Vibrio thalassae TaxID=1243014 RepID=A0A240EKV9_9VIBR|nr:hypothetical protein VTH8203_02921 [Vibrio thalassae]
MQQVVDINWWQILVFSLTLLVPFVINSYYKLNIGRDALIGLVRMTLQLALVGVYLEYLFYLNSLAINVIWLFVMIVVGSNAIVSKAKLPRYPLITFISMALVLGLFPIIALLSLAIIQPEPAYSAQYVTA